jgi:biotin synthase
MVATPLYHSNAVLSAGRMNMSREGQAMCFFAGANLIFADKIIDSLQPDVNEDMKCLKC